MSAFLPSDPEADAANAYTHLEPAVRSGQCVLFLGSAVHASPPPGSQYTYAEGQRPPFGTELSRILAAASRFTTALPKEKDTDLLRVAQYVESAAGRSALNQAIRSAVEERTVPSAVLKALASLDFRVIVTTNYDTLVEQSLHLARKVPFVSVYHKNEGLDRREADDLSYDQEATPERPLLFKIHGDINRPDSMVVTDEDYIHFVMRMAAQGEFHPLPGTVREALRRWPTLFIGYSLRDYNLRLLFKTLRWKLAKGQYPDTYSIDKYPDPLLLDVWHHQRRYVNFVAQDVWSFVPELYRRIRGHEMPA